MNNHQAFYGSSCQGTQRTGDEYICPKPTIGNGPGHLGRLAYCAQAPAMVGASHKQSAQLQSSENGRSSNGYFIDVAAVPIGNRPVHSAHNLAINSPAALNGNLMDREFNCQQPFWCEKCI
jgi:hypothetical protein